MITNPGPANSLEGQKTRRLACDRCRSQKLKCVRSEIYDACQRCTTAKAHCSYGRPLPPGRPPTVRTYTTEEQFATTTFQQKDSTTPRPSTDTPAQSDEPLADLPPLPAPSVARPPAMDALQSEQWFHTQPPEEVNMLDMFFDDALMADLDSSILATAKAGHRIASQETVEQIYDLSIDTTNLGHHDIPMTPAGPVTLPPTPDAVRHTGMENAQRLGSTLASTRQSPTISIQSSLSLGGDTTPTPPALMQQLMQLSSIMYDLQSTYSPSKSTSWPTPPSPGSTFPTELAGKVLRVAIEFLRSLRCFFLSDESSSSSAMSTISTSRPSEWLSNRVYTADKSTALQLIANYLRLLQLYLLLYNAVYDYMKWTESGSRHSQPIWHDLTIGDAPLYQFPDFQIKLVLQVAARLLGQIEAALGLSEGCRVSKKSATEGSGILERSVTPHFIEVCMSEVTTGAEQGRGVVARLRELMRNLMKMLDASVWVEL